MDKLKAEEIKPLQDNLARTSILTTVDNMIYVTRRNV